MFSSNNSSSGGNKGKRRSFFLWGSGSGFGNPNSQTPTVKNSSTNGGSNSSTGGRTRTNSSSSRQSPMKSTLDKKPMNNRNPFIPSDRPSTTTRSRLALDHPGTPRTPSVSEKQKVSSPHDSTTSAGIKNKNSSSHLSSHGNSRGSSASSSHRNTSPPYSISSDKVRNSSHKRTSSTHKQKSSASSTSSISPKKEGKREISSSSSHSSQQDESPLELLSSRKPSRARRPPPPVDLTVLRNSMKKVPEDRPLKETKNAFLPKQDLQEKRVTSSDYLEKEIPPLKPQEIISEQKHPEQVQTGLQETGDESNPKHHRRQRSEAEKFEEELDYFIKEHSAVQESPSSQRERFEEEEAPRETDIQNFLNANSTSLEGSNKNQVMGSPLTNVDPLKLSEETQVAKLPSASQHSGLQDTAPSLPGLASPPTLDPMPTAGTGPLLEPPPPPLPPKEPLEPLGAVYSSPQPTAATGGRIREIAEAEKRKSSTSPSGDEHGDRFSFTHSLNDTSVKSIQQVALDDSRGAAPIVSNLSYQGSMDFAPGEDDTNAPISNNGRISHKPKNSLDRPPLINDHRNIDYQGKPAVSKNPFLNTTAFDNVVPMDQPGIADPNAIPSNEVFDQRPASEPTDTEELPPPRRKFRVVNEDRPTFYMNGFDESVNKDEFDDTATNYSAHSQEVPYDKRFSIIASEKSNTFVPMNLNNQSLESQSPSLGIRSGFVSLDSASENEAPKSIGSSSKTRESVMPVAPCNLSNHQSMRSNQSNNSSVTFSSESPSPDKSVRLVSSYVEELRLKYFRTSNFLQAPPNLPVTLKQKNNLVQPKNVKVKIRTNSKQIGIKHGRAKQKLFTLETTDEDIDEDGTMSPSSNKNKINVDHTREFRNLLNNKTSPSKRISQGNSSSKSQGDEELEEFMNDIPGDDAYDSDDAMAPLRERRESNDAGVTRSSTVKSYFTKQQERLQQVNKDSQYEKLPSNINIEDYLDKTPMSKTASTQSGDSDLNEPFSYGRGLHVANPDSASD